MIYTNTQFKKKFLDGIAYDWKAFIKTQSSLPYFDVLIDNLTIAYNENNIYPKIEDILKPLKQNSLSTIKVIIIGQDPYHTPGVADGLAFSSQQVKVPPSLKNIFKELKNDLGIENVVPSLERWSKQGVFLLNSILSVEQGKAKSHHKIGWQEFVINLIKFIDNSGEYIFVLWGNDASKYQQYLNNAYVITGYHPSPLAQGKFFGYNYFSQINEYLAKQNKEQIDWRTSDDI